MYYILATYMLLTAVAVLCRLLGWLLHVCVHVHVLVLTYLRACILTFFACVPTYAVWRIGDWLRSMYVLV